LVWLRRTSLPVPLPLICGRDQDKLDEACASFVAQVNQDHGGVEFFVNNAGRSIRRAIESSYNRFHDYERTMQLNYFGSLRVTTGFLPGMVAKCTKAMWSTSAALVC